MTGKINEIIKKRDYVISPLLLKNYINFGISSDELIILIYIINDSDNSYNPKLIMKDLNWSLEKVLETINSLSNKSLIKIELVKNGNITEELLSLDGLYEKMSFSIINDDEIEEDKTNIFSIFEKEFGRTLSPIETELILAWKDKNISEELIVLALKEAIYNGVSNLRYIDRILYEWGRKGFKNKADVDNDKKKYQKQKSTKKDMFEYDWLNEND